MAFVPARCTQCGAPITVDDTKEAGICEFCGTPFVTEKVIHNTYVTNNVTHNITQNYAGAHFTVQGQTADGHIAVARTALAGANWKEAYDEATKALSFAPDNAAAWLIKLQAAARMGEPSYGNGRELAAIVRQLFRVTPKESLASTQLEVYQVAERYRDVSGRFLASYDGEGKAQLRKQQRDTLAALTEHLTETQRKKLAPPLPWYESRAWRWGLLIFAGPVGLVLFAINWNRISVKEKQALAIFAAVCVIFFVLDKIRKALGA